NRHRHTRNAAHQGEPAPPEGGGKISECGAFVHRRNMIRSSRVSRKIIRPAAERAEERALAVEHRRHVTAEWPGDEQTQAPNSVPGLFKRGNIRRLRGGLEGARADWKRIGQLAPGTQAAMAARVNIEHLELRNAAPPAKPHYRQASETRISRPN